MRAVVLAGGLGTRLAPYTHAFPKPLMPIGNIPIIEIVLRQLRGHGIEEVVISVGYLAQLIQAYFLTRGGIPGLKISYLQEAEPLGTAGAVGLLHDGDDGLLVLNGDILTTLDFSRLMEFHAREQPALTVAVHPRTVQIDLGVLDIDPFSAITGYSEKPTFHYQVSMGVYVYSPCAVRAIGHGEKLDLPDLVLRLISRGERVLAFQSDSYWLDIGRRDDYERAQTDFALMRQEFLPGDECEVVDLVAPGNGVSWSPGVGQKQ
jgi:NDP-sugar pyrophosphorylase family protein